MSYSHMSPKEQLLVARKSEWGNYAHAKFNTDIARPSSKRKTFVQSQFCHSNRFMHPEGRATPRETKSRQQNGIMMPTSVLLVAMDLTQPFLK